MVALGGLHSGTGGRTGCLKALRVDGFGSLGFVIRGYWSVIR